MKKNMLTLALALAAALLSAADLRLVRLEDFAYPRGEATLGGEFPGAQAELSFPGEGRARHARLAFDLTKGNYVGYSLNVGIPAGTTAIGYRVRTPGAAKPRLFCRVLDADGQYHMYRAVGKPSAEWSKAACDLAAPHGHWGGKNDGVIRWPLRNATLGIEVDKAACPTGALEVAEVAVRTSASRTDLPALELACTPSRFGALYGPKEDVAFRLSTFVREPDARIPAFAYSVRDWQGREVLKRTAARPDIVLKPADFGDQLGAFQLEVAPAGDDTGAKPVSTWFARLSSNRVKPCPWIGSGLHGGHGWGRGDFRFLDILATAGIGVVRDEPGWSGIERAKGVYQVPANFEKLVDGLHARGIGFNVILDYGNRVYENPLDPDAFAKWCAFMAGRFGGKVRTWEIWNEPQNFWFRQHYGKTNDTWVAKFVELTRKADDAIRAVRPDADVAVTAEDVWPLLKQMLEQGVAREHNLVSFHPYCHGQPRPEREVFCRNGLAELRETAAKHGGAKRFIITEAGWTTYTGKMKFLEVAGGYPKSSYVHQAQYLVRMYAQARQLGVEYACQYDFKDDGPDRSYTENNFGLVHEDYSPKPSLAAVAELARRLGDAEPKGDCSKDPAKYRFYRFHRPDGDAYLAWAVEGACEVELPAGLAGRVQALDLMGNPLLRPSTQQGRLALDECPVYLEVVDGAFEEMVAMPDGVKLYTFGAKPAPGVKCPIVIQRNPYVKERPVDLAAFARGQAGTLQRGYARVVQHCRGAGMSEGVRVPYEHDRADGLALLDWVRRLPWYNGEIYLEGGSYLTSVHWSYLDTDPKDVKGAYLTIQEVDRYNVCYRNGFFKAGLHGGWFSREYHKTDHALTRNRGVSFADFPLEAFSTRFWGRPEPALDNVLRHPRRDDPFWQSHEPGSGADYRQALAKSSMPILLKTGLYDIYTEGLCDMWREIPAARRANCALLIDAYDHGGSLKPDMRGTAGEFPGGARADERVDALDWFDAIRKGAPCPGAERNRTKYYALWENAWHVEPSLADGARKVSFKLGAGSRAYTYDPKRPLPDFPGSGGICFGGMQVQPKPGFRDDVVSFVLPPLTERLDVRGRMTLDLAVASDCEDTCFYARVDVRKPDGRWYLLRDDITSLAQSRDGKTVSFRFADHAFRLEPGDVLRVDVASANSQFAPHPNVKGDAFAVKEPKVARNTVFADRSRLTLHVLPPRETSVTVGADVVVREDMVPMRDGVRLYTRAAVPKGDGKYPVVFVRTPYESVDRAYAQAPGKARADAHVRRGYVHLVQHCRGAGASEGLCRPYVEREDGLDTLAWIRRQPWYNGEVFLEGGSYLTSVHLTYLSDEPPDIKGAAFSIQTDRMQPRQYRNGCNYSWCNHGWWWGMVRREFPNPVPTCVQRPYRDLHRRAFGVDDPRFTGMLEHVEADGFWTSDPRWNVMEHIRFPVLWTEGWWDFYIEGMVSMWERMPPEAKAKSLFVMKPMAHGGHPLKGTPIPESKYEYGISSLDFFDAIRAGRPNEELPYGRMAYHSVGADAWRTTEWPKTEKTSWRRFALGADGALAEGADAPGEVSWTYDPNGPRIPGLAEGKCQRAWAPKTRQDAIEFVSRPFAEETAFFGKARVRLPVKSDCDDTQVFLRIDLVDPEGTGWNVCQTISSLRHAKPGCKAGETVTLDLAFPLAGFTVKKGWGVRLDVCSDGGVYVPHANVAKHWAEVRPEEVRVARNALVCGAATLELPLE